jgi:hypothetical protein
MTSTPEAGAVPAASAEEPKATKKATAGARRAHVAPKKAKSAKKASPGKRPRARRKRLAPATAARPPRCSNC